MEKKITKVDRFNQLKAIAEVAENADLVAFIDHEIELLDKKSANKKPTKTQEQNEALKEVILSVLSPDEGMTASEVLASSEEFAGMSNQKITTLLTQLKNEQRIIKTVDKKRALFTLA